MSLLLDTHAFLWWVTDSSDLSRRAREAIADPGTPVFVSAASAWEISIKRSLGRIDITDQDVANGIAESGFLELAISARHALKAGGLPDHHRDPFDRMLVAQSQVEGLTLITRDRALAAYEVPILPA